MLQSCLGSQRYNALQRHSRCCSRDYVREYAGIESRLASVVARVQIACEWKIKRSVPPSSVVLKIPELSKGDEEAGSGSSPKEPAVRELAVRRARILARSQSPPCNGSFLKSIIAEWPSFFVASLSCEVSFGVATRLLIRNHWLFHLRYIV